MDGKATIEKVVMVGAGKVAKHLGTALYQQGITIVQVVNRTYSQAERLAKQWNAQATSRIMDISKEADLYLIAVSDDAIPQVAEQLSAHLSRDAFIIHTSGATNAVILFPYFDYFGVFYPVQTFTEGRELVFRNIPICISASSEGHRRLLEELAEKISDKVYCIEDEQRLALHLAAVFANNFSNHLYQLAEKILQQEGLSFEILHAIIEETAAKVKEISPLASQTGPAIRGDKETISRHLAFLKDSPTLRELYRILTKSINPKHILSA